VLRAIRGAEVAAGVAAVEFGGFKIDFGQKLLTTDRASDLFNPSTTW
jgi:predicted sugar kinase